MTKSKKTLIITTFLGLLTALAVTFTSAAAPSYLKAVTYSGDTWVINFWNSETDYLDEDMAQIAADGFNGIILVVPWREFQPYANTYSDYAFQKLDEVMNAAETHGLWVELRVSYRWDYYPGNDFAENFRKVLYDESTQSMWRSYMERVYKAASAHSNFYGGFITWEDFWNYVPEAMSLESADERVSTAALLGYQDYLREHYTLDEINAAYHTNDITSYETVPLPSSVDHPGAQLFYDFYDEKLLQLLALGQQVFPNLSMEVRLDSDGLDDGQGGIIPVDHYKTFGCGDSSYTSLMYAVYMGATVRGQDITAAQAIDNMNSMLGVVKSHNEGKPIFIDQLLYRDNTEGFEYNPQIYAEELPVFLSQLAPTLRNNTCGYGVWAYRNYRNSPVYNYGFALGTSGWTFSTSAKVTDRNGSRAAHLQPQGTITQKIRDGGEKMKTHNNIVAFTVDSDEPATVTVTLGALSKSVEVNGLQNVEIDFGKLEYDEISFSSTNDVWIDDIFIYNFIQDGQLYDVNNNELSCIGAIRSLNSQLN